MSDKELPVLIYTMGRVSSGSCSIALGKAGYHRRHHIHILNEDWRDYSGAASPATGMTAQQEARYEYDRKVRREIIDTGEKALVISFIREPLTRNMSAFFMNRVDKKGVDDKSPEGMRRAFLKRYPHFVPLEWYHREFNKSLGINVFDHAFDPQVGYRILETDRFRILLLRTEMTNEAKGAALSDFLGVPVEMEVYKKSDKYELKEETNELYREFKKEVKFRKGFLDYLYDSEYARHFMSESEIEEIRGRWQSDDAAQIPWRTGPDTMSDDD
ncbi:MAG: putative capsular polysaccharide synthesis family protein [Alphaproteobacteria bacterium]|nr:putative capsular polysaccharide synthesis family protein [Alphaproteobacteria bacterium]